MALFEKKYTCAAPNESSDYAQAPEKLAPVERGLKERERIPLAKKQMNLSEGRFWCYHEGEIDRNTQRRGPSRENSYFQSNHVD
jgi:hypothetical protein